MRRTLLVSALIVTSLVVVAFDAGDPLFVQVRETELRATPGFLSQIEQRLEFGEEVSYLDERSGWMQVTVVSSGATGWIHATAVKENRSTQIQLEGERTTRTVTSREVALAGRGFSENLEDEYGNQKALDFSRVDELEAASVDPTEIIGFVQDAELREDFLTEAQ